MNTRKNGNAGGSAGRNGGVGGGGVGGGPNPAGRVLETDDRKGLVRASQVLRGDRQQAAGRVRRENRGQKMPDVPEQPVGDRPGDRNFATGQPSEPRAVDQDRRRQPPRLHVYGILQVYPPPGQGRI